ncbi:MAG TPA: delta-aminolevulinic acid dehydratase [Bacteroidales bacterium]|nr:delta-aminolevulinic acid dehydratase [Bacteroidales bacterium]
MSTTIRKSLILLEEYCRNEKYKGYDPYDGLNSKLFNAIPFISNCRVARLVWIQFFKRSLINFRPLTGVEKGTNPKALGLFLSGYCNLHKLSPDKEDTDIILFLTDEIRSNMSKNWSGACWGYNFDWQARAFFLPKYTPTVVATSFISSALLDAYEITGDKDLTDMAKSSCEFIIRDLNRIFDDKGNFAFSYSPRDKSVVYNASLLGSRLLARMYSIIHDPELIDTAEKSVAFCCSHQNSDGSWNYGSDSFQKWIDNFHTGFNLESLADYIRYSDDHRYDEHLRKGFEYYINTFFTEKGISKYYNNSVYPVDIHAPAQLIITLSKLGRLQEYKDLADKVLMWTIRNMQSEKGYFYFQKNRIFTSKIPYMRWAQAWMFYALTTYLLKMK